MWPRMTLGHVYDLDLKKNENLIKEVIIQAQGEVYYLFSGMPAVLHSFSVDGAGRIHQASQGDMD